MWLRLLVDVAATYRLTRLMVDDEIAAPVRDRVGDWARGAEQYSLPERVDTLINCHACVSVWAGAAVQVLPYWARCALACSAGTLGVKWVAEATSAAVAAKSGR